MKSAALTGLFIAIVALAGCSKTGEERGGASWTNEAAIVRQVDLQKALYNIKKRPSDARGRREESQLRMFRAKAMAFLKRQFVFDKAFEEAGMSVPTQDIVRVKAIFARQYGKKGWNYENLQNALKKHGECADLLERNILTIVRESAYVTGKFKDDLKIDETALDEEFAKITAYNKMANATNACNLAVISNALLAVKSGMAFTNVIERFSQDADEDLRGGLFGVSRDNKDFSEEQTEALFAMKVNDCSDIIDTEEGYLIVKRVSLDDFANGAEMRPNDGIDRVFYQRVYGRKAIVSDVPDRKKMRRILTERKLREVSRREYERLARQYGVDISKGSTTNKKGEKR